METTANMASNPIEKDGEQSDEWVNAVLDLIKLTNQGKLLWKRTSDPSIHTDEYETKLGLRSIRLEKNLPKHEFESAGFLLDILGRQNSEPKIKRRTYPYLRVYDASQNLLAAFPDIAPLKALANAVEAQVAGGEYGILKEIHEAAEMA